MFVECCMKTSSKGFYDEHSSLLHLSNLMTRTLFCKSMKDFNYVHSCFKIKQTLHFEGTTALSLFCFFSFLLQIPLERMRVDGGAEHAAPNEAR